MGSNASCSYRGRGKGNGIPPGHCPRSTGSSFDDIEIHDADDLVDVVDGDGVAPAVVDRDCVGVGVGLDAGAGDFLDDVTSQAIGLDERHEVGFAGCVGHNVGFGN